MRIKLHDVSGFLCLPLPPSLVRQWGVRAGEELELVPDATRDQIILRPARAAPPKAQENPDFTTAVEGFLARHGQAMADLAGL